MASSDLRKKLTPIRDQLSCGSCTAFGTIGAWEGCLNILRGVLIDLSEQDLFFCSGGGCSIGNEMDPVLNYARDSGVCLEECCPYDGREHKCGEGKCTEWWASGKKLDSWRAITNKEEMKITLNSIPLVGVMEVHQSFMNYQSGVYHSLGWLDPILGGHCISIVGYDDEKEAWLLRNSWGTGWGEDGYCWIKYGDSEIDTCMYEIIPDGEIPPQPNPPTPSPCKVGKTLAKIINFFCWLGHRRGRFFYLNPSEGGK